MVKIQLSESSKNQAIGKIQDLVKLIEKKYDYIEARYDLGAYRKLIGDYDGAIEAYDFVIKILPKDEIAYVNLGDLYGFYLKDYGNAEKNFLAAISINPGSVNAYSQLAAIYEYGFNGKAQVAESLLLSGVKSNPSNAPLKILLAQYYERRDRKSDALEYFKEALILDPGNESLKEDIENLSSQNL